MRITWFGAASLLLESGSEAILFDPFISLNMPTPQALPAIYAAQKHIVITHGHFDHLSSVPEILQHSNAQVFCTAKPAQTLARAGVPAGRVTRLAPQDSLRLGPFNLLVKKGKHISFDLKHIAGQLFNRRVITHLTDLRRIYKANKLHQEGKETVIYEIEAEGKRITLLGSLALSAGEIYDKRADLLLLPYQGRSDLEERAAEVLARLEPKAVMLHHWDDAFPPVSQTVKIQGFAVMLAECFPNIRLINCLPGGSFEM